MAHVGIDLEQFVVNPYSSGIQRVLQYLARDWPEDVATCDFVIPYGNDSLLLTPQQAADLIAVAFSQMEGGDLRSQVAAHISDVADFVPRVNQGELLALYTSWLLPEVSYLPDVLERFARFHASMPTTMIGYDALPMTEPANYRFTPGQWKNVSSYFMHLASTDSLVCISQYAKDSISSRLRRKPQLRTVVAHPGANHIAAQVPSPRTSASGVHFLRVGTLEARKMPVEIMAAFRAARALGIEAQLTFIGRPSASDASINECVERGCEEDIGVSWIQEADDPRVWQAMMDADWFVSVGVEGYGIPVLEALSLGTPVLYAGTQPAAELMDGQGATCIGDASPEALVEMFVRYSTPQEVTTAQAAITPRALPTWQEFSRSVALACV